MKRFLWKITGTSAKQQECLISTGRPYTINWRNIKSENNKFTLIKTLTKNIIISPIGSVEKEIIYQLANQIAMRYDFTYQIGKRIDNIEFSYHKARKQYDSKEILKYLIKLCPSDTFRFIAITDKDIFVPILQYIFGLAQIKGSCLIVSLHRLWPQFYNQPPDFDLLLLRAEKTIIHELGHTFSLTHCRNKNCVMYSSTKIEDTDAKPPFYCPTCFELIKWYLIKHFDLTLNQNA